MESSEDKQWASKYLLDPLTAPDAIDETGPGTHYGSTFAPNTASTSSSQMAEDKRQARARVKQVNNAYPSPPDSPNQSWSSHRKSIRDSQTSTLRHSSTAGRTSSEIPTSSVRSSSENGAHRRHGSLDPRDDSQRPLEIIRKESLRANRAPHLRRKQQHGVDTIDRLGAIDGATYHHSGPYDAASLARNQSYRNSPVEALAGSNREALRATPREKVVDSITRHRPLDGVAVLPPGMPDSTGRSLNYKEGPNLMIEEGGDYKRWSGIEYLRDDIKGKGEPSYSIEKALKASKAASHRRHVSESGVELTTRPRSTSGPVSGGNQGYSTGSRARAVSNTEDITGPQQSYAEWEGGIRRSDSSKGNKLMRKFGSLRRRKAADRDA